MLVYVCIAIPKRVLHVYAIKIIYQCQHYINTLIDVSINALKL